jgi:hypothetical protein
VYRRSKHYGRTSRVTQVGNPRLTVHFDDGLPGKFVDIKYARLLPEQQETDTDDDAHHNRIPAVSGDDEEEDEDVLVEMFHRLVVQTTVTTLADTNSMADVESAINDHVIHIRQHALKIPQR